ncbi:MAG: amino acid transporter [Gammaproteobacteria bacterium]|nr:MAG: amino acid transporter [Gammaproteobacteria bacterium]
MNFLPLAQGFFLGGSMIIPIGAQNAFIINQGVKRQFHLLAATLCILGDVLLISLGVFGGGEIIASNETLSFLLTLFGILFLTGYGMLSFRSAFTATLLSKVDNSAGAKTDNTLLKVVITCFAVTLLNPHAYIDTVVILGGVGGQFIGSGKVLLTLGCIIASTCWFYGLSISASRMSYVLSKPKVKKGIDISVGIVMLLIAIGLTQQL